MVTWKSWTSVTHCWRLLGALTTGLHLISPVNWHLTPDGIRILTSERRWVLFCWSVQTCISLGEAAGCGQQGQQAPPNNKQFTLLSRWPPSSFIVCGPVFKHGPISYCPISQLGKKISWVDNVSPFQKGNLTSARLWLVWGQTAKKQNWAQNSDLLILTPMLSSSWFFQVGGEQIVWLTTHNSIFQFFQGKTEGNAATLCMNQKELS